MGFEDIKFPITIVNNDGTPIDDYPKNPLWDKWLEKYPPMRHGHSCGPEIGKFGDGRPMMNYTCVICTEDKCPYSQYWKVPEEDKEEWEAYRKEVEEYDKLHGNFIAETADKLLANSLEALWKMH